MVLGRRQTHKNRRRGVSSLAPRRRRLSERHGFCAMALREFMPSKDGVRILRAKMARVCAAWVDRFGRPLDRSGGVVYPDSIGGRSIGRDLGLGSRSSSAIRGIQRLAYLHPRIIHSIASETASPSHLMNHDHHRHRHRKKNRTHGEAQQAEGRRRRRG